MKASTVFFLIAVAILILVAGAWIWQAILPKPTNETKIMWFERPASIKPKKQTKTGTILPKTPETAKRDTIVKTAPCDSLRELAQEKLQPFGAVFENPFEILDSLGSVTAMETDSVQADPWTRKITLAKSWAKAVLKLARIQTTERTTSINWLVTVGAFALGILVAIFLSR